MPAKVARSDFPTPFGRLERRQPARTWQLGFQPVQKMPIIDVSSGFIRRIPVKRRSDLTDTDAPFEAKSGRQLRAKRCLRWKQASLVAAINWIRFVEETTCLFDLTDLSSIE